MSNGDFVSVRAVAADDRAGWEPLYSGYAAFYRMPVTGEMLDTVWSWLMDPDHEVEALVAELGGALVGLAHFRRMPSPLRATDMGFLDDLFVDPNARGHKVGEAIFDRLEAIRAERGWPRIRWLTADDNYRARGLYDRIGRKTSWNLYEMGD